MAFTARSDSELESALDALGFSHLEDIPVEIHPRYRPPTRLLQEVEALLAMPLPAMDPNWDKFDGTLEREVLEHLDRMEREKEERKKKEEQEWKEHQEKKEQERKRKELEAQKKKEEEEKQKAEMEETNKNGRSTSEEEEDIDNTQQQSVPKPASAPQANNAVHTSTALGHISMSNLSDNNTPQDRGSTGVASPSNTQVTTVSSQHVLPRIPMSSQVPFSMPSSVSGTVATPPQQPASLTVNSRMVLPPLVGRGLANSVQNLGTAGRADAKKINYSDFEAELDPFERLELKSINDMQELEKVLQTSTASSVSQQMPVQNQQQYLAQQQQGVPYPKQMTIQQQQQTQMRPAPPYPQQAYQGVSLLYNSPYYQPNTQQQNQFGVFPNQPPTFYNFPSGQTAFTRPANPKIVQVMPAEPVSELKPSKSYGDLLSEMEKEEKERENLHLNIVTGFGNEKQRKKSSITPPPRVANVLNDGRSGKDLSALMEDWVPWPDLDTDNNAPKTKGILKKPVKSEPDPMDLLTLESRRQICRNITEMGFPLARVVRTCQALNTDDSRQIINFCLLVNKFIEEEGFKDESEVEHVLLMKSADEKAAKQHLQKFTQLKEFGFDSRSIHDALLKCNGDKDKALEQLLKF